MKWAGEWSKGAGRSIGVSCSREYFVDDGNNRVSVARFHGVEWIDAEVTESKSLSTRAA